MPAVVRGVVGQIKWHYYVAAAINNYTVSKHAEQWSLRAVVVLSDAFKMSQRPLMFVAPFVQKRADGRDEPGEWRWPIQTLEVVEGMLTASLGPPDEQGY